MATIGFKDVFMAEVTEGIGGLPDTYGDPERLAKGITAELTVNAAEAALYADDSVDEFVREFSDGELKIGVNDLASTVTAKLLGQTAGTDGVIYASGDDDPPYFAIGFSARKTKGLVRYVWLYKVKFSVPGEKFITKGDKIEFSTPEITGKVIMRPDGKWKADYVGAPDSPVAVGWFTEVVEPT